MVEIVILGKLFCKLLSTYPKCNIHSFTHFHCKEASQNNRKSCCKQKIKREKKTTVSQLAKATEKILICPLNNSHCGNYCSQQVPVVETKQILCLSVYAACWFVCLHESLIFFYFLKMYISYGHQHLVSNFPNPVGLYWYIINKFWIVSQIVMHNIYSMVIWVCWTISI